MSGQMRCARCDADLGAWITSWMTLERICMDCSAREKTHARYAEAKAAELEAVQHGDLNYPGLFERDKAAIADLYQQKGSVSTDAEAE